MLKKNMKRSIAFVVITLSMLVMFGEGYATGPDVTLVVNPKATEIYAGSEKIVITVDATGKNLTFTWKLSGPGKLEDEGAAAFYIPPEKIDQKSASAVVTVTVKEPSGQETVKSVAFTILPSPDQAPTPSPVATPLEEKKMSKGKITALGLGAAAVLGGGIALAVGGGDDNGELTLTPTPEPGATALPETCAGTWVGGYCWYLGLKGASCTSECASHGGYHEATRTYAGSHGTDSNCYAVLSALGAPADSDGLIARHSQIGQGCSYWIMNGNAIWARDEHYTLPGATFSLAYRACACAQ